MNRVAQIYGYAVCLVVAVLIVVSFLGDFVDGAFARVDPLHTGSSWSRSNGSVYVSFEAYRLNKEKDHDQAARNTTNGVVTPMPADSVLQRRFESERATYIADVRATSAKDLVKSGILLLMAIVLFVTHWRWVRRQERLAAPA